MRHDPHRVSPFRHLRINGCLAPPRSLSQLTTSFFASWRPGIRLLLFLSFFSQDELFLPSPIQFSSAREPRPRPRSLPASVRYPFFGHLSTPDRVVGLERLELSTSRLSGVRSSHLSYRPALFGSHPGGGRRNRTAGIQLAKLALSRLSYTPNLASLAHLRVPSLPFLFQAGAALRSEKRTGFFP